MRRLRDEIRNTDPDTLVRLCHDLPAKMNEIYRLKAKKIPSNFDPRKSPLRATAIFAPPDKLASSPSIITLNKQKKHVPVAQWVERWLSTKGRWFDSLKGLSLIHMITKMLTLSCNTFFEFYCEIEIEK